PNTSDGSAPMASLLLSGSKLYGTASSGGSHGSGTVFSINTDGSSFQPLYPFTGGSDGATPLGALTLSGTILYGTASAGGVSGGYGSVFSLDTSSLTFSNLYTFTDGVDGANPTAGLVLAGNTLYGTVSNGINIRSLNLAPQGCGGVFSISTNGSNFTILYGFTEGNDGFNPASGLLLAGSTLYGTAYSGGADPARGSIFELSTTAHRLTTLVGFDPDIDYAPSGSDPQAPLVISGNVLFGTAVSGGGSDAGMVFSVPTNGAGGFDGVEASNFSAYNFSRPGSSVMDGVNVGTNSDGFGPYAGMLLSGNNLYGTANDGGLSGFGTIFSVTTNFASFTNLYNFTNGIDGANPQSGLIISGNVLYGTATQGGKSGFGSVYSLNLNTKPPAFKTIYSFTNGADGYQPLAGLVLSGNKLYGSTSQGAQLYGAIFSVNTDGTGFNVLYTFTGGTDGGNPASTMLLSGNTLYGTASRGSVVAGTVFSLNLGSVPPVFTPLHTFTGDAGGAYPMGALTLSGGILYGTTYGFGGTAGTIFAMGTNGAGFTVLYVFAGGTDGGEPDAGVILSGNTLYGTAGYGGISTYGNVFKLDLGNFTSIPIPIGLQISPSGPNHVVLTWNDPAAVFSLQSAPTVTGVFTNVPGASSPFTNAVTSAQQFFRLAAP
ncbi:MAG TPA: choice-of-anchor tandem repeat GloVer-containing protein, partial [Candidatus Saccharimonadales bacterium]|nr:choice-of-anchor tandem repeat GloVer-containing protein [Candidatus Saccharimonadales bacterium]